MKSPLDPFHRLFLKSTSRGDINLAAHNGLDSMLDGHLIKFDRSEHISMIGQSECIHSIFFGQIEGLFESNGPVQQTVLTMEMKVYKIRMFHRKHPISNFKI